MPTRIRTTSPDAILRTAIGILLRKSPGTLHAIGEGLEDLKDRPYEWWETIALLPFQNVTRPKAVAHSAVVI